MVTTTRAAASAKDELEWCEALKLMLWEGAQGGLGAALATLRRARVVDERQGELPGLPPLPPEHPPEIVPLLVDFYPGKNNAHARGIGEPATVPTAAAVANAIAHATGIRPTALPITPARILEALSKAPKREVRA